MGRRGPKTPLAPDFWGNVKVGGPDECWEWQRARLNTGYGILNVNGKRVYAHRRAYELAIGPLGKMFACHHCDNPPCCNPAHLFAGTNRDNMQDCVAKGRHKPRVAKQPKAPKPEPKPAWMGNNKLTPEIAVEIRALYAAGGITYRKLASRYGVSESNICRLIKGYTWKEVTE